MRIRIERAAVLGAGVMGSGIAAHLANAGIPVLLLDVVPGRAGPGEQTSGRDFRDRLAAAAKAKLRKQKPSPLMSERAAELIETGNLEDDWARLGEVDWIIEVIKEDLALKHRLFERLEGVVRPTAIVSSNTSGLSIQGMTEGRSLAFRRRFLVTHFFNPVRYMKLLELVAGVDTDPSVLEQVAELGERVLGKGIVYGRDTTNFVANRVGTYGMMRTLQLMVEHGLTVEEVDKILGPALGRPSSAVFRTADLVGLDTFLHVARNCHDALVSDEARSVFAPPPFLEAMVAKGLLGDKAGGGFYKKVKGGGGESEILVLDLATHEYRKQAKVRFASLGEAKDVDDVRERVRGLLRHPDKAGRFAEHVTLDTLAYAARRLGEIADDVVNVDRALRWGFGWELGPFETWDAYGVAEGAARMRELGIAVPPWVDAMLAAGRARFYAQDGAYDTYWDARTSSSRYVPTVARQLAVVDLRRRGRHVAGNESATLWDAGDGVALLEFHCKMNSIDALVIELLARAVDVAERDFRGLVVANDGANFSAGANLAMLLWACKEGQWEEIRKLVRGFQGANQRLRTSTVPTVAAPFGLTLGGGCEIAMAVNAVQAAAETYIGLVEVGVGLIPGGGGNLALLRNLYGPHAGSRDFDPLPFLKRAFLTIGTAKVATSAEEGRELCYLPHDTQISMSRDHLLADAKARCLGLAEAGFRPPRATTFFLGGRSGAATVDMMLYDMVQNHQISEYDRHVGRKLATVLTGGDTSPSSPVTEARLLELELEAFLSLCGEVKSQDRMQHMLEKGKPLRN